jgi:hypothetical protein
MYIGTNTLFSSLVESPSAHAFLNISSNVWVSFSPKRFIISGVIPSCPAAFPFFILFMASYTSFNVISLSLFISLFISILFFLSFFTAFPVVSPFVFVGFSRSSKFSLHLSIILCSSVSTSPSLDLMLFIISCSCFPVLRFFRTRKIISGFYFYFLHFSPNSSQDLFFASITKFFTISRCLL